MWGIESENQKENIFHSLVLKYAEESEEIKARLGLDGFFEKELSFWQELKESPEIFQSVFIEEYDFEPIFEPEIEPEPEPGLEIIKGPETETKKEQDSQKKEEPALSGTVLDPGSALRILIIGDSFVAVSGGVGEILERELLKCESASVFRKGKVSSGLSRPDYYDWLSEAKKLVSLYDFNAAVIMIGSNDAQSLTSSKGKYIVSYGAESWNNQYSQRVSSLLDIFKQKDMVVFWAGFPIMKSKGYAGKIKNLNSIYQSNCKACENAYYIPLWDLFADSDKKYTAYLPDENGKYKLARQSDGIHLTYFGGTIAVKEIIQQMNRILNL